jgi:cytochrome c oxidase subunit I
MGFFRLPMTVWNLTLASAVALLSLPALAVALGCLFLDRVVGTSFFVPAGIVMNGIPVMRGGGQPLLWQHLFWFFGHPEVYLVILPAMGIISDVVSVFARRPLFGYCGMVCASVAISGLGFLVWGHHMFVSGMNPALGTAFMLSTVVIAVPSGIKIFNWLGTLWRGSIRFESPMLCVFAFLLLFLVGGLTGIFLAVMPINIHVHNTYFVVGHLHFIMAGGALFGILAGIYYWFPKFTGRMLNERLAGVHVIGSFLLFVSVFYPMFLLGLAGEPRRMFDIAVYPVLTSLQPIRVFQTVAAFMLFGLQALFLINVVWSLRRGRRAPRNPWEANSLEWTVSSPPPAGNFDKIPTVFRGPYEYSQPGRTGDWHPQSDPD